MPKEPKNCLRVCNFPYAAVIYLYWWWFDLHKQKISEHFCIYISCAAVLFLLGSSLCCILPSDSYLYSVLEGNVVSTVLNSQTFNIHILASSFAEELKYLLFVLVATFCLNRNTLFCLISAYKGMSAGICSACLMRAIKLGNIVARFEILGCLFFVILSVAGICILCYTCTLSMFYSKNIIYPPKIKYLLKRKDTFVYLLNFFALCGASLVIILLKHGNLFLLIFPKGL